MEIILELVIVLVADDNHCLDDDYPLQHNLSKQAAATATAVLQEISRGSAYGQDGYSITIGCGITV